MKYKIIKLIPIVLFSLFLGIPFIIYNPSSFLALLIGVVIAYSLIKWYDYFDKKDKKEFEFRGRR